MNRTITDFRKTDSVKKKKRYLKLLKSVRTQRRVICEQNARIHNLEEKNTQLSEQYSTISNAFFWRVTGPVRFVLDVVKMVAHSHNAKTLIRNGLHSLMKEGVGVTREKVQNYHDRNTEQIKQWNIYTEKELASQRMYRFPEKFRISIVVPLYNTPEPFLREMMESVIAQTYGNWELCMADGSDERHASIGQLCLEYAGKDPRIRYKKLEENGGISKNTNACVAMSTGEYIAVLDHDDLLHPAALYEVMRAICEKGADFVYTDEAVVDGENPGQILTAHFKPDFAPDTLRSNNYICHFSVFKRTLLEGAGQFDPECDGSQDHDMTLRLTEQAKQILHIPEILYYWRSHAKSTASDPGVKSYTIDAGMKAVKKQLDRLGIEGKVSPVRKGMPIYRVRYAIKDTPKVSILICNPANQVELQDCLNSIFTRTSWPEYEIVMVVKDSAPSNLHEYCQKQMKRNRNLHCVIWNDRYNSAAACNFGAAHCTGEYLILLDSNTQIVTRDWIQELLMFAQRADVGAVGAKIYNRSGKIQYAGLVLGMGREHTVGRAFYNQSRNAVGYMGRLLYAQNCSAVSEKCMMMKMEDFIRYGGMDEVFDALSTEDLCLRLREQNKVIVWTPFAELMLSEKGNTEVQLSSEQIRSERLRFQRKWKNALMAGDAYYNPNFNLTRSDCSVSERLGKHDAR